MPELSINLQRSEVEYKIYIDDDSIVNLKSKILKYINADYAVVISEKVNKLYGKKLGFNKDLIYVLKDGEKEKNFNTYKKIMEFLQRRGLTRKSSLIAIGGGVCGDITGFAASTYMRGIDFIQVPTTLLAAVDSSVGGKTAIDTKYGKNLIGTFYQPKVVLINTNFLDTLDERQYKSGLGEVLKYGFIEKSCGCKEGFGLLKILDENCEKVLNKDKELISQIIDICLKLKIAVVEADEKESRLRQILNFGHTWGHAIEKYSKYRKTHGECVVEGMKIAFDKGLKLGLIEDIYYTKCVNVLKNYGYNFSKKYDWYRIDKIIQNDKKADVSGINYILPCGDSAVEI